MTTYTCSLELERDEFMSLVFTNCNGTDLYNVFVRGYKSIIIPFVDMNEEIPLIRFYKVITK